ncbi:acyl carrier protein [Nitrosomonas sp. JL21]|nr:acyl carrier protein [Nitrosomonas sp. JL21]
MIRMDNTTQTKKILSDVLGLNAQIDSMSKDTVLLGNIPELDSVAVVAIIVALEKNFSITIHDDEISAQTFQTLGTLINFIDKKVALKTSL